MKTVKRTNARTCYRYRYRLTFWLHGRRVETHWIDGELYFASLHKKQGHKIAYRKICEIVLQACRAECAWYAEMEVYCIEERISNNWNVFHLFHDGSRKQMDYGIEFNNWARINEDYFLLH